MRRKLAFRQLIATVFALYAACFVISHCMGCKPAATEEAKYTTALVRCVDKSATLAESKACRDLVDSQFGVTTTVRKDAGQ